jgi:hypothetical protein
MTAALVSRLSRPGRIPSIRGWPGICSTVFILADDFSVFGRLGRNIAAPAIPDFAAPGPGWRAIWPSETVTVAMGDNCCFVSLK